jgi:hypothetical protein
MIQLKASLKVKTKSTSAVAKTKRKMDMAVNKDNYAIIFLRTTKRRGRKTTKST